MAQSDQNCSMVWIAFLKFLPEHRNLTYTYPCQNVPCLTYRRHCLTELTNENVPQKAELIFKRSGFDVQTIPIKTHLYRLLTDWWYHRITRSESNDNYFDFYLFRFPQHAAPWVRYEDRQICWFSSKRLYLTWNCTWTCFPSYLTRYRRDFTNDDQLVGNIVFTDTTVSR